MAAWKQHELTILNNYHGERLTEEPLDDRSLDAMQQQLPNRSRAAIKKKYLERKAARNADTTAPANRFVP